jgi:hypothetical protein
VYDGAVQTWTVLALLGFCGCDNDLGADDDSDAAPDDAGTPADAGHDAGGVDAGPCDQGASSLVADGHCYFRIDQPAMSWQTASDACAAEGGHLVAYVSAGEETSAMSLLAGTTGDRWIGLTDSAAEGDWVWETGEPLDYTNWNTAGGQPDGSSAGDDCALHDSRAAFHWGDADCAGSGDVGGCLCEVP